MVNLAMGSGWPIDQAPNPSYMYRRLRQDVLGTK
jgi:hypothetical protein